MSALSNAAFDVLSNTPGNELLPSQLYGQVVHRLRDAGEPLPGSQEAMVEALRGDNRLDVYERVGRPVGGPPEIFIRLSEKGLRSLPGR